MISSDPDVLRRFHEAAHAVVVRAEGCVLRRVTVESDGKHPGSVKFRPYACPKRKPWTSRGRTRLRGQVRIWMAGRIAEEQIKEERSLQLPPMWTHADRALIDQALRSLSADAGERKRIHSEDEAAANSMVTDHWPQVVALADQLTKTPTMTGSEVEELLAGYP